MWKVAFLSLLTLILQLPARAASITLPYGFSSGQILTSTELNSDFNTIYSDYNGNITNVNIATGAAIALSKIAFNPGASIIDAMATNNLTLGSGLLTDTLPRVTMTSDGYLEFGPGGSAALDIGLQRSTANTLQLFVPGGGTPVLDMNSGNITNINNIGSFVVPVANGGTNATALGTAYQVASVNAGATAVAYTTLPIVAQGRLSLSSTLPVPAADVTGATTIYYLPFTGSKISLWDSTHSAIITDSIGTGVSIALTGQGAGMYDVYASDATGSGTVTLSLVGWSSTTSRAPATALAYGTHLNCLIASGTETSRYLGSVYLYGTGTTEDTAGDRALWNYYNRVGRAGVASVAGSWGYTTGAWRASNGNVTNGQGRISYVVGVTEEGISTSFCETISTSIVGYCGIALDVTNSPSVYQQTQSSSGTVTLSMAPSINIAYPAVGYHFIQAIEQGAGSGTTNFNGGAAFSLSASFRQ